jgi:hypothetical protein
VEKQTVLSLMSAIIYAAGGGRLGTDDAAASAELLYKRVGERMRYPHEAVLASMRDTLAGV